MKQKIYLDGGGFRGLECSSGLNKNKIVEWTLDKSQSKISISVDRATIASPQKSEMSFGWFCESSSIIPNVIKEVLGNLNFYKRKYKYIFSHDRRIVSHDPSFFKYALAPGKPWIQNKQIYEKNKLISFIGSNKVMCAGHRYRQSIIRETEGKVDHYGSGFGARELPAFIERNGITETGKLLGLKDYMFSIAMENDNYPDIFTEKITDCFAVGTIPIFWGSPIIGEHFDKNGIIMLEDLEDLSLLNSDLYNSKMESIQKNFELCKKMPTAEDFIFENYLKELL